MITESGNITAVLKLQTSNFTEGLEYANQALGKFEKNVLKAGKESVVMEEGITTLTEGLDALIPSLSSFNKLTSNVNNFNKFANGVRAISTGLVELSSDSINAEQGITILNNIMQTWKGTLEGTTVQVKGLSAAERTLANSSSQTVSRQEQLQQSLANLRNSGDSTAATLLRMARALDSEDASIMRVTNATTQYASGATNVQRSTEQLTASIMRDSEAMQLNAAAKLRSMGYTGRLSVENTKLSGSETQVAGSADKAANSLERQSASANKASNSLARTSNQASRLRNVLMSVRSAGMLVGSMLAYNFAHHLAQATNESIQAKSEMEGYFKMLHYGQSDIDEFNKALDDTVSRFQRVNKYSLGETISSIGVEFNLTTKEMVKAMDVTSMVTSEYLRAGRNANEASLAVKDVLQGQFQRLSRETGVGKEELIDAGWTGDPLDTNSLLDALREVGESRHWDVFAEKANSLNDIVTILQNRFGEWAGDMVNVVQPSIVNAFNSIMSFGEGLSQSLSGMWQWLNTDGWEQTAVKIGMVSTAILTLMPMITSFRSGASLLQVANMSLSQSLGALVFGLEAETLATHTSNEALAMKLLGITEEEIAETNLVAVINGMIVSRTAENVATTEGTVANLGFTGGLYAMISGEAIAEGTTIGLTGAIGLLTGAFLSSPIGWFTLAILGLASAFYVLSGGLDDSWDKMKQFNEVMKDPHQSIEPYKDKVESLNTQLEEAKVKYGENSAEVEKLDKKLQSAKETLSSVQHEVEHGVYWNDQYQKSFDQLGATMDSSLRDVMKSHGYSKQQIDETGQLLDAMDLGTNKVYHALQVMHKQQDDANKSLGEYADKLKTANISEDERIEKMSNYASNLQNLQTHSAIANTTDDWWEWLWNSFYAGMDQFWIDWDNFWISPNWKDGWNGLVHGLDSWIGTGDGFISDLLNWDNVASWFDGIKQSVTDAWNNFISFDWLWDTSGTGGTERVSLSAFLDNAFGIADDVSWAFDWVNDNLITPLDNEIQLFMSNPSAYIMGAAGNFYDFITALLPIDDGISILTWVNTNIITPMANGIATGIASIPILGDIAQMLGLVPQQNQNAYDTGFNLIDQFKQGVEQKIRSIPIVGDIAQMLGLIPQQNPNAHDKGYGIGDNIKQGEKQGQQGTADNVRAEMTDVIKAISGKAQEAFNAAANVGQQIWDGINSVLDRHSPGMISREVLAEFGTDIPESITSSAASVYSSAHDYAQNMYDGMNSVSDTGFGLGGMVGEYESDAEIIAYSSQMMGNDTTLAFNEMQNSVNTSTNLMQSNVNTSYTSMQQRQATLLNNMKSSNNVAYNEMVTKSNQSLINMRDSTINVTSQMTDAWVHMKNQIVSTANKLKSDTTVHFNSLSNTIGSFYKKIQNPSNWGAGIPIRSNHTRRPVQGRNAVRTIKTGKHGAGINPYKNSSKTMSLRDLMRMVNVDEEVNIDDFLSMFSGGFGWNGWNTTHYKYIKNKADDWDMKAPQIMGYIPAGDGYKVKEFEGGTPKITWSNFMSTAESVFSTIPYKFYYDSNWKGNWVNAIKAGACNCSDGSDALIALAQTMGFNGHKVHTITKGGIGHFYAVINGHPMDTTHFQEGGSWSPLSGAGVPVRSYGSNSGAGNSNKERPNITVVLEGDVYGVDDLDNRIRQGVDKGLQEHLNDPYSVPI